MNVKASSKRTVEVVSKIEDIHEDGRRRVRTTLTEYELAWNGLSMDAIPTGVTKTVERVF